MLFFVELPKVGAQLKGSESFRAIESVKAVNEHFAPVSGEITQVNTALADSPEIANKDPYGAG